jgi:D-3-phosphoglycerate dehydrogenase
LPEFESAHRIMHIHENVKGILAQINTILTDADSNIFTYKRTTGICNYRYDIYNPELEKLKEIPNTIKYRILY